MSSMAQKLTGKCHIWAKIEELEKVIGYVASLVLAQGMIWWLVLPKEDHGD